jgi:hypothetical protein
MTINVALAVQQIYPGLQPNVDFVAQDDGEGPFLTRWKSDLPKPTPEQLASAWAAIEANPPVLQGPPDFGVFEAAVHTDTAMTDAVLGAFFGDAHGRGNLLMASLQFAVASGDYTRVNRLYASLKTAPPTGMTSANMQAIGQHAADAHFPITP